MCSRLVSVYECFLGVCVSVYIQRAIQVVIPVLHIELAPVYSHLNLIYMKHHEMAPFQRETYFIHSFSGSSVSCSALWWILNLPS